MGVVFLVAVDAARGEDFRREDWRDGGVDAGNALATACERLRGVDLELGVAVGEDVDGMERRGIFAGRMVVFLR